MADSLISRDLKVDGDLRADGGKVVVAGWVKGNITARTVEIVEKGTHAGAIKGDEVLIQGTHVGKITSSEVTLSKTASVQSDVAAKTLKSEKGATLIGNVAISGD